MSSDKNNFVHLRNVAHAFILVFPFIFFTFLVLSISVCAESISDIRLDGYVNDYANVISPEDKAQMENMLDELYKNGSAQVAIVTIHTLNGASIEDFSLQLAHGKIGDTKKDNGLLYLVVVDDRQYRIEVGYGLESVIPDILAGRIGRNAAENYFRNGEYSKGILFATGQIYDAIKSGVDGSTTDDPISEYAKAAVIVVIVISVMFALFAIFAVIYAISMKHEDLNHSSQGKKNKNKKDKDELFETALLASVLFGGRRGGGSGGFGGGLGGLGGGGFGGFGGGGFGGGGAGGRW